MRRSIRGNVAVAISMGADSKTSSRIVNPTSAKICRNPLIRSRFGAPRRLPIQCQIGSGTVKKCSGDTAANREWHRKSTS